MARGFAGTTLRVDLTRGTILRQPTDEALFRRWHGGRGVVAKICYDEVPRDADPLGPENVFIITTSPMSGCLIPAGSKVEFGSVSPLTNGQGDSNMGGHLGPALKFAGYDMVIFKGISPQPVYLTIDNDAVELKGASAYWGMKSLDLEKRLKEDLGEDFEIATIGPAGENGILFSCITHDFGRQAGRTGQGTVMGSKRLKAIAVRGNKSLHVHNMAGLTKHVTDIIKRTQKHPNMEPWQKYGTAFFIRWSNDNGVMPTRNFQTTYYEDTDKIDGDQLVEKCLITHKACFGCWMNCGKYTKAVIPGKPEVHLEGPEYETGSLCGANLGMKDINHVAYINWLLDNLGMDSMSGGGVIAFAMECFERGLVTEKDLEGHQLRWGSVDDVEHFLDMVAYRRGIGDWFARGTRQAAERIGRGSEKFAMQVKGQEMSGYDGRWAPGMLLSYMTADIGAHHNRSWTITVDIAEGRETIQGRAKIVVYLQHIRPLMDTWCICRLFWGELDITPEEIVETLNLITGWGVTPEDCLRTSEMTWNLNRCHYLERNRADGRTFDYPPARSWEDKIPTGPGKGKGVSREQVEAMLDDYYAARGWDQKGNPTRAVLEDLGLKDAADNLERIGLLGVPIPGGIPPVRGQKYKPKAF
ncbi:MAG: aldehyde ferredoxin oxidoreductase family protein [Candidatus Aminicenantes bacterium]|nr:aldehyde ferredoxin oxidoreductase family protein [Candidatus Aminicenantes bacterium]